MDEAIFNVYYGKKEQKSDLLDFLLCAYQSSGAIPKQLLLAKERFPNVCVYSLYPEVYHITIVSSFTDWTVLKWQKGIHDCAYSEVVCNLKRVTYFAGVFSFFPKAIYIWMSP